MRHGLTLGGIPCGNLCVIRHVNIRVSLFDRVHCGCSAVSKSVLVGKLKIISPGQGERSPLAGCEEEGGCYCVDWDSDNGVALRCKHSIYSQYTVSSMSSLRYIAPTGTSTMCLCMCRVRPAQQAGPHAGSIDPCRFRDLNSLTSSRSIHRSPITATFL